jgi:hypothetical protein
MPLPPNFLTWVILHYVRYGVFFISERSQS